MIYEHFLSHFLPARGDVAIDVGANGGQYLERLVTRFRKVVAFEPQVSCYDKLRRRFGGHSNVVLARLACGEREGAGELRTPAGPDGEALATLLDAHPYGYPLTRVEPVRIVRLDEMGTLLNGRVDFLKIDVEGADLDVLRGAEKIIRVQRPAVQFEEHVDGDLERAIQLLEALAPNGYSFEVVPRETGWKGGTVQRWLLAYRVGG
jgi:FkbM family methyltransferase